MKNIIITGSSSGFGFHAVKTLASKGHVVYATMRNVNSTNKASAQALMQWASENKAKVEVVEMDVTDDLSVKNAISHISKSSNGIIDVLVNNAGIYFIGMSETLTMEQTEQMFAVNVLGADRMMKAVLPFMHKQKDGLIINITSIQSRNLIPVVSTYNATKAALDALSIGYHYELKASGIDVATIQPGVYETTDIVNKSLRPGNPEAEAHYSDNMIKLKNSIHALFEQTDKSSDPGEIAVVILDLIEKPKGERPLWTLINWPYADQLDEINKSIKGVVENLLNQLKVL